ncbi:Duplicated hybrid motif [Moorella glycerini]|uniref:Murein hydrolase activator NlpD n=1 Tax=Neomoorella stamsii TaxID=1266720 RepID=A0A9X7P535_9FIRM|nr:MULTISPECIES: M23 family metallopeptidase [Moorella]PRR70032.1 Murein hydrolase activator NlpD precursor [Moorella stamsii]CEP68417.1 Duplicated hybrid motif [Moorella glycerini]
MLDKKMAVSLALGLALLVNSLFALPVQAAVIEDLQQVATVLTPGTYWELAARVNNYTRIYRVEEGDTLERIARRYQTDPELVAVMNYLEPDAVLTPGQFLVLPHEEERSYTVAAGDTLWDIARRFGTSVESLAAANGIVDARRLRIGMVLTIPGSPRGVPATRVEILPASRSLRPASFLWPLIGAITSGFGWRDNEFHHGLDIAGKVGDYIRAAWSGVVTFSGWGNGIYGNMVKLDHGNGLETVYAHNSRNLVKVGEYVRAGEPIAEVGGTGNATGPHVHFEIRERGKAINPERFLNR